MNIFNKIANKIHIEQDKSGNRQIVQLTYFFTLLFLVLVAYVFIVVYRDSDEIINNSYNKRESLYAAKTVRGSITTDNGEILAYTDVSGGNERRVYPYGRLFAHSVGYNTKGKAGIESIANFRLLNSNILFTERIYNDLNGNKNPGDSVVTSLNLKAQYAAYEALGNRKGAVVLMDANNGYILAMVSKPDFDPNEIDYIWDEITNQEENSILLNRATQGLYPPGSTFKILTALEYIKENKNIDNYEFECKGSFEYRGTRINCFHGTAHGDIDFDKSFAKSCNSSFANITTKLSKESFKNTCEELLFNEEMPSPLLINKRSSFNVKESFVPINSKSSVDELMQTGIGQGRTEVTPYHMCLMSAAIANEGVLMNPIIVKEIETAYGDHIESCSVRPYKRLLSYDDSVKVKELMREVVTDGTGTALNNGNGYIAYGKTGSAEFSSNKSESHAWFTGFAEGDNGSKVAISVIVEGGGSGGQVAGPVAKAVFDAYYN
ncbi:MAG: penicillin-binding transpeptidase domain-containing protein [Lachnospiraceae bacterium]|nr:penicillin-binding transpeptidase domain-containing protein [Lachnospiraceae bacterium]